MASSEEEKDELVAEQAFEHAVEVEAFLPPDDLPEPKRVPFSLTYPALFSSDQHVMAYKPPAKSAPVDSVRLVIRLRSGVEDHRVHRPATLAN